MVDRPGIAATAIAGGQTGDHDISALIKGIRGDGRWIGDIPETHFSAGKDGTITARGAMRASFLPGASTWLRMLASSFASCGSSGTCGPALGLSQSMGAITKALPFFGGPSPSDSAVICSRRRRCPESRRGHAKPWRGASCASSSSVASTAPRLSVLISLGRSCHSAWAAFVCQRQCQQEQRRQRGPPGRAEELNFCMLGGKREREPAAASQLAVNVKVACGYFPLAPRGYTSASRAGVERNF